MAIQMVSPLARREQAMLLPLPPGLLQLVGEVEAGQQLLAAPGRDPREVPPLERVADRDHRKDHTLRET